MSNTLAATRLRVLVVDDDADQRKMLAKLLSRFNCDAHSIPSGQICLEVAEWIQPHVVVIDLSMPDIDGFQAAKMLAERGMMPPLLVALTGYDDDGLRERSKQAGFHLHLTKPIHFATLNLLVREAKARAESIADAPSF